MIKLILFYSEGLPFDNGINLINEKNKMINKYLNSFDEIIVYSPRILKEKGYADYCKEYKNAGVILANAEQKNIGFSAWKPLICRLELEKSLKDDIIVYHDVNCSKYKVYLTYTNIRETINEILNKCNYDFFLSQERVQLKHNCKLNVLQELGNNDIFNYNFYQLCVNFIIFKNTEISLALLNEWEQACKIDPWINGELYEIPLPFFQWHCPEQSILNNIIANWIKINKNGIDKKYPFVYLEDRDLNKIKSIIDYNYLQYLP